MKGIRDQEIDALDSKSQFFVKPLFSTEKMSCVTNMYHLYDEMEDNPTFVIETSNQLMEVQYKNKYILS